MKKSSIKQIQLDELDNLEILSVSDSNKNFPLHYHETFCISIIEKGAFVENDKVALQGSILVSNPFEVHKNSSFKSLDYSLKTLYVSSDVFDFALEKYSFSKNSLLQNLITDDILFTEIKNISQLIEDKQANITDFESKIIAVLNLLSQYNRLERKQSKTPFPTWFTDIQKYLDNNLNQKISLEKVASRAKLDKFQFIRAFKKHIGLTPFQYIVLSRIALTKKLLQEGYAISQTALEAGFYDQSNFANYFKNYVGVTPRNYQQSFNILQDL